MADKNQQGNKLVESIHVRRVPQFNQAGGPKRFSYAVSIVTGLGNSGTFDAPAEVYEDDVAYAEWLRESIFQLDKSSQMVG